jgi:glycosyltransferase involved in cell wall biosynthesis
MSDQQTSLLRPQDDRSQRPAVRASLPGPLFTVFTPTFNRRDTLHRVYESLRAQTFRNFEWLVIDDGSADGTEFLIRVWESEANFPIRYCYQLNSGKHIAFNRAIEMAKGELFLPLDSDDECLTTALERLAHHWGCIPADRKSSYSGITVLCQNETGQILGTEFPQPIMDSNPIEMFAKYHMKGEKWGFHRTELLREYPFPDFPQEKFMAEALVWNRIGRKYQIRYINEPLRIYHQTPTGLSSSLNSLRASYPLGARLYYHELLQPDGARLSNWKSCANYIRFSLHAHIGIYGLLREADSNWITVILLPLGWALFMSDTARVKIGKYLRDWRTRIS